MRRSATVAATGLLAAALVAVPAASVAAAPTQTAILAAPPPVSEFVAGVSSAAFAWVQNTRAHPHGFNVYAHVGSRRFRVNPAGTHAGIGGGIDGTTLAYARSRAGNLDIALVDLRTGAVMHPPAGVDTAAAETAPSISGGWLLYQRDTATRPRVHRVLLTNLSTGATRVLATEKGGAAVVEAGQVNGDWAAYTAAADAAGPVDVFLYRISTATTYRVPNPAGRVHSAAATDGAGTVYFDASGHRCGAGAEIQSWAPGGAVATILRLRTGTDLVHPFVRRTATGARVYFDKLRCASFTTDVYEVTAP